jgi:thioredoxin 1
MIEVTDENFEEVVENSPGIFFLFFKKQSCGPCREFVPVFEKTAVMFSDKAQFGSLDVRENPINAKELIGNSFPSVVCFVNGKPHKTHIGSVQIYDFANRFINPTLVSAAAKLSSIKK